MSWAAALCSARWVKRIYIEDLDCFGASLTFWIRFLRHFGHLTSAASGTLSESGKIATQALKDQGHLPKEIG